jgi:hypothetical protein
MEVSNLSLEKKSAPLKSGTRWKAVYPERLSIYAARYGRTADCLKDWIRTGKEAGSLPPLQFPEEMNEWYGSHVGPVPNDLLAKWAPGVAPAQGANGNGAQPLDLRQAVVEVRKLLGQEIATLNRASTSDARRSVLLRSVRDTSDSLCRLETTLANIRRDEHDVLSWGEFAAAIHDAVTFLMEMRKSFPHRIMAAIEKAYSCRRRRIWRVAQLIKEPLMKAAEEACKADVQILANSPELRPVIEHMQKRFRELEEAALQAYRDGETPVPLTFEPIEASHYK